MEFPAEAKKVVSRFLHVEEKKRVCLHISPDRFVKNDKTLLFANALHDTYVPPFARMRWEGRVVYKPKCVHVWEIVLEKGRAGFFLHTDAEFESFVRGKIAVVWPDAAVSVPEKPVLLDERRSSCVGMNLLEHHMLSLDVREKSDTSFTESVLRVHDLLKEGDLAIVQIVLEPESDEWQAECNRLLEEYKMYGHVPAKLLSDPKETFKKSVEAVLDFAVQSVEGFIDSLAGTEKKYPTRKRPHRPLSPPTFHKTMYHGFLVQIRMGCQSESSVRREQILKSLANAFREFEGDNRLQPFRPSDEKRTLRLINERKPEFGKEKKYLLSAKEMHRMFSLPSPELQKTYPCVKSLAYRETDVPTDLLGPGVVIGEVTRKGESMRVSFPVDNLDVLCLPRVVIGQMGSGKSSYAATFARSAFVDNNFNIIAIDVADGRMCDSIRDSIPPERKADIVELDFGNLSWPIGLSWNEAQASMRNSGNRLCAELLAFMEKITGDFGPQMRRWLKKAAQAVYEDKNATILDVILMLVDDEYRARKIPTIRDVSVRQAWIQFQSFSERQKMLITSPVLNRLDYLLDDDNMKNILCQVPKKRPDGSFALDLRKLINQDFKSSYRSRCILVKVPVAELGEAACDAVVAFVISKIWLTVQTRDRSRVLEHGVPTFLIMDEPHQFMSSAENWKRMVVESRKWRLGLVWLFHTWEQIRDKSKELAKTIKSAGVHYVLFASSKDTWKELQEEITPYTVEEALELPRHHAIIVTHTKDGPVHPFLAKMEPPVNVMHPVYDNSDVSKRCIFEFGRHVREVESEISKKELLLLGTDPSQILDDIPIVDDGKIVKGASLDVKTMEGENLP